MNFFRYTGNDPGSGSRRPDPPPRGLPRFFFILFYQFFNLAKLSLIFTLFCLPLLTIPAALTAMSKVSYLIVHDEIVSLWADFIETFRKEIWRSTLWGWLLLAGIGITASSAFVAWSQMQTIPFMLLSMLASAACALLLVIAGFYLFIMLAIIDLPGWQILKNAFLLAILYQPFNLAALGVIGALLYPVIRYLPLTIIFLPLLFFALLNFIAVFCASSGIKRFVLTKQKED